MPRHAAWGVGVGALERLGRWFCAWCGVQARVHVSMPGSPSQVKNCQLRLRIAYGTLVPVNAAKSRRSGSLQPRVSHAWALEPCPRLRLHPCLHPCLRPTPLSLWQTNPLPS